MTPQEYHRLWRKASDEHALMLRAEGCTYREIATYLRISPGGAQHKALKAARELSRAMRRIVWPRCGRKSQANGG